MSSDESNPKKSLSLQQRLQMQMQQRRKKQLLQFKQRASKMSLSVTRSADANRTENANRGSNLRHRAGGWTGTANTTVGKDKAGEITKGSEHKPATNNKGTVIKTTEAKVNVDDPKKQERPMLKKFRQKAREVRTVMRVLNSIRNVSITSQKARL